MADSDTEYRTDRATVRITRTAEGFAVMRGRMARPGIYLYRRADGSTRRELVPREVLQDPEYLSGFLGSPVTSLHPDTEDGLVSPENAKQYAVGSIFGSEYDAREDRQVVDMKVWDAEAIQGVDTGEVDQLSPAYKVGLDRRPGVDPEFGPYDVKQTSRRHVNHGALVPNARGGPGMTIRRDSDDHATMETRVDNEDTTTLAEVLAAIQKQSERFDKIEKRLDGLELQPEQAPAQIEARAVAIPGRTDAATVDLDAYYRERAELEQTAKTLGLDISAATDVGSARRMIVGAVSKTNGHELRADASDETVAELFNVLVKPALARLDSETSQQQAPSAHESMLLTLGKSILGGSEQRADAAREKTRSGRISVSELRSATTEAN